MKKIDGMMLKDMFLAGATLLERNRASIDALNVFPVPDGDTGTNMSQTISMAVKDLRTRTAPRCQVATLWPRAHCERPGQFRGHPQPDLRGFPGSGGRG